MVVFAIFDAADALLSLSKIMQYAWLVIPGYTCFILFTCFLFHSNMKCRYLDLYKTLSHNSCYDQYCYTSRASLTTYLGSSKRLFCFYYLVKTIVSNSLYSSWNSSSVLVNVWIRNLWLNRNILKLIYRQLFQGMIL